MIDNDNLLNMHGQLVEHKEHLWDDHGQRDMNPRISMLFTGGHSTTVPDSIIASVMEQANCNLSSVIELVFSSMSDDVIAKLEMFHIAADGYQKTVETDTEAGSLHHGDMAREFAEAAQTDITEMVFTLVASNDLVGGCDIQGVRQTYVITDGGHMVWGSPQIDDDAEKGGPLVEVINKWFRKEL